MVDEERKKNVMESNMQNVQYSGDYGYEWGWEDDLNEEEVMKMTFESLNDAKTFYNIYAKCIGFGIRRDDVDHDKDTNFISMRRWVCSKEGYRESKWLEKQDRKREPRTLTRTGCLASFPVRYDRKIEKFIVTSFSREHNHSLMSQDCVSFLWSHRNVKEGDIAQARAMQEVGWRTSDIMKYFANQARGYQNVGYILKDLYNHLDAESRADITDGDAVGALAYLSAKKDSDPLLFFDYGIDEENRLCRLFLTDSQSQVDYKIVGDILVFDTTYRTNAYNKPLVILTGVNNHYMTVIFACALLSNENEDTYIWVLETLVRAMDGKKNQYQHLLMVIMQ